MERGINEDSGLRKVRDKAVRAEECRAGWGEVEGLSLALGILLAFLGNYSTRGIISWS